MAAETLIQRWLGYAGREPDRVFAELLLDEGARTLTHGELLEEARRYARLYRDRGVRPGSVVLVILRMGPELHAAFLGAMLAGCIPSFMPHPSAKQDPDRYWSSHRALFARIGAGAILAHADIQEGIRTHIADLPLLLLEPGERPEAGPAFDPHPALPGDIAFLQHSSGTTGLKKGVALAHGPVLAQVDSYAAALGLRGDERFASWLPLYHDMGFMACFILPLMRGIPIVQMDPFAWAARPAMLLEAIHRFRCTHAWLPNFAFQHLCRTVPEEPSYDLGSMRAWIDCSEPCRPETFDAFARRFGNWGVRPEDLQVCYAMAETVFATTQTAVGKTVEVVEDKGRRYLEVGPPIPGMDVEIRNPGDQPLPEGQVGEICIRGTSLFSGYFHLEEETARRLRAGWYHSGDLGFLSGGRLCVTGRSNDLIIIHGRNFYAHDIEHVLNGIEGLKPGRNVGVGLFLEEVGSEELLVIAETEAPPETWPALSTRVKRVLLDAMDLLPREVRPVPPGWLVKTTSGKISRSENLKKHLAERHAPAGH